MDRRTLLHGGLLMMAAAPLAAIETDSKIQPFIDPDPLQDELEKYPKCSQCTMDRREYHLTRHLIHYDDGSAEGSCSIRCVAVSLIQNLHKYPTAVYAADFGAEATPRPLVNAEKATYIIGGKFPPVMTLRPKTSFRNLASAKAAQIARGGEIVNYDEALEAAFIDLARGQKWRRIHREEQLERRRMKKAG